MDKGYVKVYPAESDLETVESCPLCGSEKFDDIASVDCKGVRFLVTAQCKGCGFVLRRVRPTPEWFDLSNDLHTYRLGEQHEARRYNRYANLASVFNAIIERGRLLDVGTGTGTGLKAFQDAGWDGYGVEPDLSRAKFAGNRSGFKMLVSRIEDVDTDQLGQFDLVTVVHTLEHFHQPVDFMLNCLRPLRPDGHIYVEVPDLVNNGWRDALHHSHLSIFSSRTLGLLASRLAITPVYRIESRTKPKGQIHLGLLFKKERNLSKPLPLGDIEHYSEDLEWASVAYLKGLPEGTTIPISYEADAFYLSTNTVPSNYRPRQSPESGVIRMAPPAVEVMQLWSLAYRALTRPDKATRFLLIHARRLVSAAVRSKGGGDPESFDPFEYESVGRTTD